MHRGGPLAHTLVLVAAALLPRLSHAEEALAPETLVGGPHTPTVVAYAPRQTTGPAPITVVLHGMCGDAAHLCAWFAPVVTESSWLICPRAPVRCEGGGYIWPAGELSSTLDAAVAQVAAAHPGRLDESGGRTLIGFSQGAFRGLDLAHAAQGKYPRVLLIAAMLHPSAPRLEASGVRRLLFAAGRWDMTYAHLSHEAQSLARQGLRAHFEDLGPVGHRFPADFSARLRPLLRWLQGDDSALEP